MMSVPWLLHDAELALWPAWQDGMPFLGPGDAGENPLPLLSCKSSLTITETIDPSAATGHDWRAAAMGRDSSWRIQVDFPDGALADSFGRLLSGVHPGGFRILTVRFLDESSAHWTLLSFFYLVPATDARGEASQVMSRSLTMQASWLQERVGQGSMPSLRPAVLGEVDWICGASRVTAMRYDPATETWESTPRNDIGDGTRHINISPLSDDENADVILSAYLPRAVPAEVVGDELPSMSISWQNTIAMRIGNHESAGHHGLILQAGHTLQAIGITEPLFHLPQSREIDEPVIVFRYLRRVYATLGHGRFCVPRLLENQDPPVRHDPAFRIAVPGPANPSTGNAGLVLLPNGAWLDGTLLTTP